MGKKLLKTFTNNIGFKILAIAFAFILWLVVYNLNDPVKTKAFTTTVTVTGRDSVVRQGVYGLPSRIRKRPSAFRYQVREAI